MSEEQKLNETGLAVIDDTDSGLAELPEGIGGFDRIAKISFFGSAAKEPRLSKLKDAGVKLNAFYLEDATGIVAPDPFGFFVTKGFVQFYGKLDEDGKAIIGVRAKEKNGWRPDRKKAEDKGWEDTTLALVLVPLGLVALQPAIIRTHKAVDRIWDTVEPARKASADASVWAVRGEAYKKASAAPPFGRFMLMPWVKDEPIQNTKRTFAKGYGKVIPTPEALVPLLADYATSGALKAALGVYEKIKTKVLSVGTEG